MSDTITFRRLRHTPTRDLLRGRISGALDVRQRIIDGKLPAPLSEIVRSVLKRTQLWRSERIDVADELIAHFKDGLAAGERVEALAASFGDPRATAKLIRRAKHRDRPLVWHAFKWVRRAFVLLVLLYLIVLVRFLAGSPTVKVDYIASLNTAAERAPADDRAWPVYREAMLALGLSGAKDRRDETLWTHMPEETSDAPERRLIEATPADAEWPKVVTWLDAHESGLDTLRAATKKPTLGFLYGPGGSADDAELGWNSPAQDRNLMAILLPNLNHVREMAQLLAIDLRYARAQGDGQRVKANLDAIVDLARHHESPILVSQLVAAGVYRIGFVQLEETLATSPDLLRDAELIALAHRFATIGGETANSIVDLSGERAFIHDVAQHLYTDDGNGDGRLTPEGVRYLQSLSHGAWHATQGSAGNVGLLAAGAAISPLSSRREVLAEAEQLLSRSEALLARPRRDVDWTPLRDWRNQTRFGSVTPSKQWELPARSPLILMLGGAYERVQENAEKLFAARDGTLVGIALELHRRRNAGAYPESLESMVPMLLPRVPVDRITGEPIRYRLIDGRPVVYSVGVDRDDDGGTAGTLRGITNREVAARWEQPTTRAGAINATIDGDWVVYEARAR